MFINVNKKYDFDNLTESDYIELIEDKIKKEKEKVIKNWPDLNISVEKGRWGKVFVIKGRKKVQIPKTIDPQSLSLDEVKNFLKKQFSLLDQYFTDPSQKILELRNDIKKINKISRNGKKRYFDIFNNSIIADSIISETMKISPKFNYVWKK